MNVILERQFWEKILLDARNRQFNNLMACMTTKYGGKLYVSLSWAELSLFIFELYCANSLCCGNWIRTDEKSGELRISPLPSVFLSFCDDFHNI